MFWLIDVTVYAVHVLRLIGKTDANVPVLCVKFKIVHDDS